MPINIKYYTITYAKFLYFKIKPGIEKIKQIFIGIFDLFKIFKVKKNTVSESFGYRPITEEEKQIESSVDAVTKNEIVEKIIIYNEEDLKKELKIHINEILNNYPYLSNCPYAKNKPYIDVETNKKFKEKYLEGIENTNSIDVKNKIYLTNIAITCILNGMDELNGCNYLMPTNYVFFILKKLNINNLNLKGLSFEKQSEIKNRLLQLQKKSSQTKMFR